MAKFPFTNFFDRNGNGQMDFTEELLAMKVFEDALPGEEPASCDEMENDGLDGLDDGLSDEMLTKCAVAFCQAVEDGGYESMVYSNLTYFYLHYDLAQLVDFPLWLAQYNETPTFYYHFSMWQYSSTGTVPGIEGNVDLNIQLIPKA